MSALKFGNVSNFLKLCILPGYTAPVCTWPVEIFKENFIFDYIGRLAIFQFTDLLQKSLIQTEILMSVAWQVLLHKN